MISASFTRYAFSLVSYLPLKHPLVFHRQLHQAWRTSGKWAGSRMGCPDAHISVHYISVDLFPSSPHTLNFSYYIRISLSKMSGLVVSMLESQLLWTEDSRVIY
jgi:hypothetical protein